MSYKFNGHNLPVTGVSHGDPNNEAGGNYFKLTEAQRENGLYIDGIFEQQLPLAADWIWKAKGFVEDRLHRYIAKLRSKYGRKVTISDGADGSVQSAGISLLELSLDLDLPEGFIDRSAAGHPFHIKPYRDDGLGFCSSSGHSKLKTYQKVKIDDVVRFERQTRTRNIGLTLDSAGSLGQSFANVLRRRRTRDAEYIKTWLNASVSGASGRSVADNGRIVDAIRAVPAEILLPRAKDSSHQTIREIIKKATCQEKLTLELSRRSFRKKDRIRVLRLLSALHRAKVLRRIGPGRYVLNLEHKELAAIVNQPPPVQNAVPVSTAPSRTGQQP